jgi:hypothetical protein
MPQHIRAAHTQSTTQPLSPLSAVTPQAQAKHTLSAQPQAPLTNSPLKKQTDAKKKTRFSILGSDLNSTLTAPVATIVPTSVVSLDKLL